MCRMLQFLTSLFLTFGWFGCPPERRQSPSFTHSSRSLSLKLPLFFEPTTSSWYALEPRTNPGSKEAREEGGTRGGHGGESAPAGGRHWRACCSPQTKSQMLPKKTQALSLEGLKRVAKELRDLVEKPEDGIWVSCSLREGRVGRGRFGIVKRRGEKSTNGGKERK